MSSQLELHNRTEKTNTKCQQQKTFEWSLRPVLNWLRFLGIALETQRYSPVRNRRYWYATGFGIILFFGNMLRFTFAMYQNIMEIYSNDSNSNVAVFRRHTSSTIQWNSFIYWSNEFVLSVGIQLAVMASTILNWEDLAGTLRQMEINQLFDLQHFKRFRRTFEIASAFIILVFKV